jgi:hypothetical protein
MIEVKAHSNGDHVFLAWLPSDRKPIADCRGFAIHRALTPAAGGETVESYLHGFVGFSDGDKLDPAAPWKFPLQRTTWSDYGVAPGDVVQYRIVPVVGPDKDHLALSLDDASATTPAIAVTAEASAHISAVFNKGVVSAQWVTRALADAGPGASLNALIATPGDALRNGLSGSLRVELLDLIETVRTSGGEIYAALSALNDPELIAALTALGPKCRLILANGASTPAAFDESAAVRAELRDKVELHDRLVGEGHLALNNFAVACDAGGRPQRVFYGSLGWTTAGLCTEANNALVVDDPALATFFLDQWRRLEAAGGSYPAALMQANSKPESFAVDGAVITQWFAPTKGGEDLDHARDLIAGAKQGVLFLAFIPAGLAPEDKFEEWPLVEDILSRHRPETPNFDAGLYIRGVVNQESAGPAHETSIPVKLYDSGKTPPQSIARDATTPTAIREAFHDWGREAMNDGARVRSDVIVIDPFGAKPVVIASAPNLGNKASARNDGAMMIVEGHRPLAAAYAVNIIAIYQTFRWNSYVDAHARDPHAWHGLVDNAAWQDSYLTGADLAETKFWLGRP